MSPAPALGAVAQDLYDALAPLAYDDEAADWALAHLCGAAGAMFQDVDDLIRDTDTAPGWAPLVDVELAPAHVLPWLAQVAGVTLTTGADEATQRTQIRRVDGQRRGRPAAIIEAIQTTLTGDRTVRFLEQAGGDAYALTAITRTGETPDPAATEAALLAAVPAGLYPVTHTVSDTPIIDEGTVSIDTATGTIDAATVADVT